MRNEQETEEMLLRLVDKLGRTAELMDEAKGLADELNARNAVTGNFYSRVEMASGEVSKAFDLLDVQEDVKEEVEK